MIPKRSTWCFTWLTGLFFMACQPAVSDLVVEQVDTAYIRTLPDLADTFFTVPAGPSEKVLGAVSSLQYEIGGGQKSLILHYDPAGAVIAMQEKRRGITVDSVAFHPNGQRMFQLQLSAQGLADGPARFFYPDGRVKEDGRYLNGKRTGIWRHFNESGRLQYSSEFDRYGNKTR